MTNNINPSHEVSHIKFIFITLISIFLAVTWPSVLVLIGTSLFMAGAGNGFRFVFGIGLLIFYLAFFMFYISVTRKRLLIFGYDAFLAIFICPLLCVYHFSSLVNNFSR